MGEIAKNMNFVKITAESLLTSSEVGLLLQVNGSSVNKWIEQGRISAFRTPGGHRRIRAADLVSFLETHKMPIPHNLEGALRRRVLLVDDDPQQLKALARLLSSHKDALEVQTCCNGIDALVQVGAFRPQLIVLDVFMPDVDGLEVCRRLKSNEETRHIDVVLTSGNLSAEVARRASEAGVIGCLQKPFKVGELLALAGITRPTASQ